MGLWATLPVLIVTSTKFVLSSIRLTKVNNYGNFENIKHFVPISKHFREKYVS